MPLYRGSRRLILRRNAIVASGPFTPLSLSGLKGWWKADAGAYTDAGTTLATNGQAVQQWNDQSGQGKHFIQATAGNKPTFTTVSLNGLPAVIGGATPFMQVASFALGGGTLSTYVVLKNTPTSGRILAYGVAGVDFNPGCAIAPYFPSANQLQAFDGTNASTTSASLTANNWYQIYSVWDGSTVNTYVGGVAQTGAASTPTFGASGTLNIFADPGGASNAALGGIAEIVVTSNASGTDRSNMQTYLFGRWGV